MTNYFFVHFSFFVQYSVDLQNQHQHAQGNVEMIIRFRMKKANTMVEMSIQLVEIQAKLKLKSTLTDQ